MRIPYLVVIIMALSASSLPAQTENGLDAKIERLLTLSGSEQQFISAIDNMIEMQRGASPMAEASDESVDLFVQEVHKSGWSDIKPKLVEIYRNNFTEEEIDHQIAYLEDPMTQRIVAKQGTVMQQSMQAGQAWGQRMGAKIAERLQEIDKQ